MNEPSKQNSTFSWIRTGLWMLTLCVSGALGLQIYFDYALKKAEEGPWVPVVFARHTLQMGETIEAGDLEIKSMPESYVHSRMVPARMDSWLVGQVSLVRVEKGEPLLWDTISLDDGHALSDHLGVNERAMTLRVDDTSGLQGMVEPGDRIDVMALVQPDNPGDEPVLRVIVQNALVMAVDGRVMRSSRFPARHLAQAAVPQVQAQHLGTMTLKVNLGEAAILAYAQTHGRLMTALRNPKDVFVVDAPDVNAQALLDHSIVAPRALKTKAQPIIAENAAGGQESMMDATPFLPADWDPSRDGNPHAEEPLQLK